MLQYIGHRLSCDGVSFAIPDGFYLNDKTDDGAENGICLLSPDQTFRLDIGIEHFVYPSQKELADVLGEMGYQVLSDIQSITINGLHGHYAAYSGRQHQYYEARFDLQGDQNGTVALVILISTDHDLPPIENLLTVIRSIDPQIVT